ncbi:hypothetical protein [Leifsonia sp. TF02-11]|uniref:hypothetical protein n=1 Tax=Leifsonia sp. TF02-11 TaxID=2815212 RepID=UPI001AA18B6C|nr:hypothetical protein [Leifsonia sp. TF02-11]MBO1740118.1 hypothetical protein [Leifsonia sp. TF02-11]
MRADQIHPARPQTLVVHALGRRVRVCARGPGAAEFCSHFSTAWRQLLLIDADPDVDDEVSLVVPDRTEQTISELMAVAESQITLKAIQGNVGTGVLLHAAALTGESGGATLLVGPSGAGKTTAAQYFGRHHGYLTDEIALVRSTGTVSPYPKPLSVAGPLATAKTQRSPNDLDLATPPAGEPALERIILLDRRPDAGEHARVSRLDLTDGIFALVPQISSLTATPRPLVTLARLIARVGGVEQLTYRSIDDLDPYGALPTSSPFDSDELAFSVPAESPTHSTPRIDDGRGLVRTRPHDAIETRDALILAIRDSVTALSGVSRSIWLACERPRSSAEVLDAVRREHGPFPQDSEITASHADQLVQHGVLRWLS